MPDAPAPTFDSHGNMVSGWSTRIDYDPIRDLISISWNIEAGPYNRDSRGREEFDPVDLEDAISHLQRTVRICGARRLF